MAKHSLQRWQLEAGIANLPTVSSGNVSLTQEDKDQTRGKVAAAIGLRSGRTYDKALKVWEAAKQEVRVFSDAVKRTENDGSAGAETV